MGEDLTGIRLEYVNSIQKAMEFITWLGERRPDDIIAVDTETGEYPGKPTKDALSPWHGRLRLVQVGDAMTAWAIPWDGWNGVFHEAMKKFQGQIICHNVAFEARWFAMHSTFDIPWHRTHDTMIAAHIIDPLGPGALKVLTSRYVDARASGLQRVLNEGMSDNGWTWGTVPIDYQPYWTYGALDCILTVRLWEKFKDRCGPGGPYSRVYDLEMATRRVVTRMELNGTRVDVDYSRRKYDELHAYAESVKQWGINTFSQPGKKRSITSNRDLIDIFANDLGEEWSAETPSGNKAMDKDQLKRFISLGSPKASELATTILRMRKASKLAETYFLNFINLNIDGIVHANVRTLGARTSRMSITDPALQTLGKQEKTVREAFIPRDEDECIITSDLDQVEFRMTASLSEDAGLIELFARCDREGGDSFTEIMRELYNDPTATKSDKRRKLVKGVVYGKLYGAGIGKMALTGGVTDAQMKTVVDAFDSQYPGVKAFSRRIEDTGMRRYRDEGQGYILTQTGRRLPCDDGKVYTLTNYAIQGGAAEVFKLDMLKCDAAGLGDFLCVPVHDELVASVPRKDVREYKETLKQCMTTTDGWNVPLTAGCDGPYENWGEGVDA